MADGITAIRIRRVRHGYPGRKAREEEVLCLEYSGGSVMLPKSVLEDAGDSWQRLRELAKGQAEAHGLEFLDVD